MPVIGIVSIGVMQANIDPQAHFVILRVPPARIHNLIGICGTGMAALAGILKEQGYHVSGSDEHAYPPMSTFLEGLGIAVQNGYAAANLNLIYFEDIANPPDYLFDACDRYGVMIGQCFYGCSWMKSDSKYPGDVPLVVQCTRDIIKRYRNHPSLVMYMASNEGFTREEVYRPWRQSVIELDGSRFWVPANGMPNTRECNNFATLQIR